MPKPAYTAPIRFLPVHAAVLGYVEWHADHGIPFRNVRRMAADLARNLKEVERATRDLMAWGAMEMHHYAVNTHFVVRLGDGRVTPALHMGLHTTASGKQ